MATRATQKQLSSTVDDPSKRSPPLTASPTASPGIKARLRPRPRPRTTLGDIGNKAAQPQVQADAKSGVESVDRLRPTVEPAAAFTRHKVTRCSRRRAQKKDVPPPDPESQTEPSQPEPQPSTSMEAAACVPAEDMLCLAFSGITLKCEKQDVEDDDDPRPGITFVSNIYNYLRYLEEKHPVKHNYLAGQEIDGNMRAITVNWLVKVHMKFKLQDETLFMTVAIIDHFLQVDPQQYVLAKYLLELCIVDYDMVHFAPSRVAAAAFCLSLKLLNGCKLLPSLERYVSYTESDLVPVMQHIAKNLVFLNNNVVKQKAVMKKYAMSTNSKISTIEPLQSSIIEHLAKPLLKKF